MPWVVTDLTTTAHLLGISVCSTQMLTKLCYLKLWLTSLFCCFNTSFSQQMPQEHAHCQNWAIRGWWNVVSRSHRMAISNTQGLFQAPKPWAVFHKMITWLSVQLCRSSSLCLLKSPRNIFVLPHLKRVITLLFLTYQKWHKWEQF